jgi:hypothetical protein
LHELIGRRSSFKNNEQVKQNIKFERRSLFYKSFDSVDETRLMKPSRLLMNNYDDPKTVLLLIQEICPSLKRFNRAHWRITNLRQIVLKMMKSVQSIPVKLFLDSSCPIKDPEYLENCSYFQVYSFTMMVIERVVPMELFGTKANLKSCLKAIREFIQLQQYENMSIDYFMKNFKVNVFGD